MSDVFGVRVTADLNILDSLIIICNNASGQTEPAVVWAGQNYFVTYLDAVFENRGGTVMVQRVSPQGVVLGSGANIGQGDYRPGIAYDGVRCLIVWCPEYLGVKGRFVNTGGEPDGPVFDITALQASSAMPAVKFGSQGYLVVWADFSPGGTDLDIYGQIITASGMLAGDRFRIADGQAIQSSPAIAFDGTTGEFFVVWVENNEHICGRAVSANGVLTGTVFTVSNTTPYPRQYPSAVAGMASFLVAWSEFHVDFDVYGNVDINVGIGEGEPERRVETLPATSSLLRDHLSGEKTLYDIMGRRVTGAYIGPGVYFLEDENCRLQKVIVIR
ncbi:hypothetical protein IBX73_00760 [candidate division WOR-3 bacterium]|nr:hypothetical protein [candidate division WOR-3 bacterium]